MKQAGIPDEIVDIYPVYLDKVLPKPEDISAVIITGSHAMVTDLHDWSCYTSEWLKQAALRDIPVLGICYGHQMLAQTFGGIVDFHPQGTEAGTVRVQLTEDGRKDLLFKVLPPEFSAHVAHAQTVINLPSNARILAKNDFEPHQAISIGDNTWGVQFHPEFKAGIEQLYINMEKEELAAQGQDIEALYRSVHEHVYGELLLKRFIELAR